MGSENIYMHHHQLQQQHQHHQQQQQQLVYSSLPSSSSGSAPRVLTLQDWNNLSSSVLGGDELNRYINEVLPNSREYFWPTKNIDPVIPSAKTSTPVDFTSYAHPSPQKLMQFENTPKGISLSDSFLKLCGTSVSIFNDSYSVGNGEDERSGIDLNQNLGFSSVSDSAGYMEQTKLPSQPEVFSGLTPGPPGYMPGCSSGIATDYHLPNFFPANTPVVQSSVNLRLPTNNIMNCTTYEDEGRSEQPYSGRISSGYFPVQQSSHDSPSNSSNKTSTLRKDAWKKEKHPKPTQSSTAGVAKKPRAVPSSSCPTLKVRKEKLGDRIAALHRMVSPFGKTDTASVLTEAMGYIHFLQDQIQRLSMTYLKSSRSSRLCPIARGGRLSMKERNDEEDERERQDLKSRGLCLVPLAFTSFVFSHNGSIC